MLYKQVVCPTQFYPDMTKSKKFVVVALAICIGLPLAIMLTAFACFWFMDKTNGTIVSSGLPRRYLLYVPNSYDRSKPTPLVITLHPAATWPAIASHVSRWNDLADQHGFIVVYPAGTGAFFDGLGRGPQVFPMGPHSLPRDIRFISDLIDNLESEYNIDLNRIYADGMSNGGGMALALSCKLSDRIAAVAAVSPALPLPWDQCGDSKPIPKLLFHGTADKLAPYHGGSSPIAPGTFPDIPGWTAHAAERNQCKGAPVESRISPNVHRLFYSNCATSADVVLYTIDGAGHTWPGSQPMAEWWSGPTTHEINATLLIWQFFCEHPRIAD
jgi:polyhydroxybutyrate depolymerase